MVKKMGVLVVFVLLFASFAWAEPFIPPPDAESFESSDEGQSEGGMELSAPPVKDPPGNNDQPLNFEGSGADDGGCMVGSKTPSTPWWIALPFLWIAFCRKKALRPLN